nr:sulfurtransferase complex subunit TusD [Colwellia sp. D2M02]
MAVLITTPPYSNLTVTAIDYIEAALRLNVNIVGVFFYQDGALHANSNIHIASDEYQAVAKLTQLHQEFGLALHLCITAAEKRGIACDALSEGSAININPIFTVSGLGELVSLTTNSTRLVQF